MLDLGALPLPFASALAPASLMLAAEPVLLKPAPRFSLVATTLGPAEVSAVVFEDLLLLVVVTVTSGSKALLRAIVLVGLTIAVRALEATVTALESVVDSSSESESSEPSDISTSVRRLLRIFSLAFCLCWSLADKFVDVSAAVLVLDKLVTLSLREAEGSARVAAAEACPRVMLTISVPTGRERLAELVATTGASSAELSSVAEVEASLRFAWSLGFGLLDNEAVLGLLLLLVIVTLSREVDAAGARLIDALAPSPMEYPYARGEKQISCWNSFRAYRTVYPHLCCVQACQ